MSYTCIFDTVPCVKFLSKRLWYFFFLLAGRRTLILSTQRLNTNTPTEQVKGFSKWELYEHCLGSTLIFLQNYFVDLVTSGYNPGTSNKVFTVSYILSVKPRKLSMNFGPSMTFLQLFLEHIQFVKTFKKFYRSLEKNKKYGPLPAPGFKYDRKNPKPKKRWKKEERPGKKKNSERKINKARGV